MQYFELKNNNGKLLYSGHFNSIIDCVECAINTGIDLSGVNLSHQNLANITLDGANMPRANFEGSNISGGNLSEANLSGSNFSNTLLCNSCLCLSDLSKCNFTGSQFGATDIAGTKLSYSTFSTISALDLDFIFAEEIKNCVFIQPDNHMCIFNRPPLLIKGLVNTPVVFFDNYMKIGQKLYSKQEVIKLISHTRNLQ